MTSRIDTTASRQNPTTPTISSTATMSEAKKYSDPLAATLPILFYVLILTAACSSPAKIDSNTAPTATVGAEPALAIGISMLPAADANVPYTASLSGLGGVKPYHWDVAEGALPTGLQLQSSSGMIEGATGLSGSYSFTVSLSDSSRHPQNTTVGMTLTVASPVSMTKDPLMGAETGVPYAAWLSANGGVGPYRWVLATGSLPAGIQLETSSGTITGVTTLSGSFPFVAQVTDSYGQGSTLPMNLTVSPTLTISNAELTEVEPNIPYYASLSVSGGIAPYKWTIVNGSLPSGIALQASNGAVSGTTAVSGSFPLTAQVTDFFGQSATLAFALTVSSPLTVVSSALAQVDANNSYTDTLAASGGIPPYNWSLASGTLPSGIQLQKFSGIITGTTSISGSYPFTAKVTDASGISATAAFDLTVSSSSGTGFDGPAELPRIYIRPALSDTPAPGSTVTVNAGDNLQAALNSVNCGDTIQLQAGSTFTGVFTFPAKPCKDNTWIIIRTSADDSTLPAEGSRLTPCYAGVSSLAGRPDFKCTSTNNVVAKLVTTSRNGPIIFASGANHYRLIGLEVTRPIGSSAVTALVSVAVGGSANNLVLDRVWIHGTAQDETTRGLWLAGTTYVAVVDSFFTDFHCVKGTGTCVDAQAILGGIDTVQEGPYKIVNNFLEASGENILFGGGNATTTPADIEIRHNHLFKPQTWHLGQSGYVGGTSGSPFVVKNLFELKNAQRVLIEGNIMENSWGGFTQEGFAILLTPKNQSLSTGNVCPTCKVTDVTIRYDYISHVGAGLQIANALAGSGAALDGQRYSIHDVVIDDIDGAKYDGVGEFAQVSVQPGAPLLQNVTVNHVTAFPSHSLFLVGDMVGTSNPMENFVFTNSIVSAGIYPIWSTGGGVTNCAYHDVPLTTFEACFINSVFASNAIIAPPSGSLNLWPAPNFFPASAAAVQFQNYNGGNGGNYHLQSSSPYKLTGTDAKDLGADIDAVGIATAGAN